MYQVTTPKSIEEFEEYYQFRWQVLRKPLGLELGSEKDELETNSIHRIVKDQHEQIIATGRLHIVAPGVGQVRYMAVSPFVQRQGIGKLLVKALERAAESIGLQEIILNARCQSKHFYHKVGYKKEGDTFFLLTDIPHVKMRKKLAKSEHAALLSTWKEKLQNTWHQQIPISKVMGVQIQHFDGESLEVTADFSANINLHNTMFAGSIYSLATLSGWGMVYLQMEMLGQTHRQYLKGDIVLISGKMDYRKPIDDNPTAKVELGKWKENLNPLLKQEKSKVSLKVEVFNQKECCATFEGIYFVLPRS